MSEANKKPLSTAGLIRVSIENSLELRNSKRVNISGPAYKIVQSVAARIKGGSDDAKSYSGSGLDEMEITLTQCLAAVQVARMTAAD